MKYQFPSFGVNILGYFKYQNSLSELGTIIVKCMESANIPYVINLINCSNNNPSNEKINNFNEINIYPINILVYNYDCVDDVLSQKGQNYFIGKYNIGIWCWELEKFCDVQLQKIKYFNEIWTISEFCKQSISKSISLPVNVIKLPVFIKNDLPYFPNIDKTKFIVLFCFDYHSIFERKNPLSVINVFKTTFGTNNNVSLIIKSINSQYYDKERKSIEAAIQNQNNIILINNSVGRDEMLSLINSCDVYISLHRSEGLGMSIKEAMYLGKPTIATNYSGNLDFMSNENSLLVDYNKIPIPSYVPIYGKYETKWADPNIEDAVKKLKLLYENNDLRKSLGKNAKNDIGNKFNLETCSNILKNNLLSIHKIILDQYRIENGIFDEIYYINTYIDIKNAINNRIIKNGKQHYLLHGKKENRSCKFIFDLSFINKLLKNGYKWDHKYYSDLYQDIKESDSFSHFTTIGNNLNYYLNLINK